MKGGGRKRVQNDAVEEEGEKEVKKKVVSDENGNGVNDGKESEGNGEKGKGEEADGEGEGEEEGEEEEEEEEEEEDEGEGEEDGEGKGVEEGQEERPKLDEGFFEIEAIRRKRRRKGQLQYLIKWRGWPETSNTWEPLENLQSCSDVIDAFEESLRSGKHTRKRKRKCGGPHVQSKKKPSRSSIGGVSEASFGGEKSLALVPFDNSSFGHLPASNQVTVAGHAGKNNVNFNIAGMANRASENGSSNGLKQTDERREGNEYDAKLSELKGAVSSNGVNADKLSLKFQEGKASEGDGLANGPLKVDHQETVQSNRQTGARRRKSGSVKRFKQDPALSEPYLTQNSTPNVTVSYSVTDAWIGIENPILTGENSSYKPKVDHSVNACTITKILKPIGFSSSVSDNGHDVSVIFVAMRSDGKEVIVDNKFLKANNPHLLINFYEQHLKYSPTP